MKTANWLSDCNKDYKYAASQVHYIQWLQKVLAHIFNFQWDVFLSGYLFDFHSIKFL